MRYKLKIHIQIHTFGSKLSILLASTNKMHLLTRCYCQVCHVLFQEIEHTL